MPDLAFQVRFNVAPLFITIPSCATSPALLFVGFMMFSSITKLKLSEENLVEAIPAYLCIFTFRYFTVYRTELP